MKETDMRNDRDVLLAVRGLRHAYGRDDGPQRVVLDGVDMDVADGEIVGLLGRSGSGKSTLLRAIAGLISPARGLISHADDLRLAMVFQSFALFPWLTVLENVETGLQARHIPAPARRQRALQAIDLIGLDGFENAYPKELSGGMRQRVGLARALVVDPGILLLDEPFSALDVLTAETLRTDLLALWQRGEMAIRAMLMVTHNIEEAVLMCDRVLLFSSNPGRVAAELRIDLPRPRDRQSPAFRALVEDIYVRMTAPDDAPPQAPAGAAGGLVTPLKPVSTNALAGLMEALAAPPYGGKADLPQLAAALRYDADTLFPIAEAMQQLRFARLDQGDLRLLDAAQRYVRADTDARKQLFAQHLLGYVPIVAHIRRVLDDRATHEAPASRFRDELEDHMTEDCAERTLQAAIQWGRYAELYAYEDETGRFTLDNPA
ncbi:nitrate ABC transporter ATP-binding protein [Bordetella genomosp. 5]|uniref:Nitrate ABC transporter ATP-binding protein n=2 Tax=Bordetella genomosp. 5 TaxID=1395608 RepID=A0A261T3H9_9BORD|nr:nitrate ABC transporter ATP-binding protein [Bordetella genomosp. 5]